MNPRSITANARAFAVYRAIRQSGGRLTLREIADRTGVPSQRVSEIIADRGWRGAPDPTEPDRVEGPKELRF